MSGIDELPLSTSSYLADTQHLSLPQHGAYLLILMTMWRAKGWIKDDDRLLANICKISVTKWIKIAPEVRALLIVKDGKLSQKRLLSESENAQKKISKNIENGRAGGIAKSLKNKEPGLANATDPLPTSPPISPAGRQNGANSSLPFLLTPDEDSVGKKVKNRKSAGNALPDGWVPSPDEIEYGRRLGLTDSTIEKCAEDMRLWARGNANRSIARKADWPATFKGWMRRDQNSNGGRNGETRQGGRGGFGTLRAKLRAGADDPAPDGHHPTGAR